MTTTVLRFSPNPRTIARVGNTGIITNGGRFAEGHNAHAFIDAIDITNCERLNFHVSCGGQGVYSQCYYACTNATTEDGRHKTFRLHQIIDEAMHGGPCPDGFVVDHKDNDTMNNRRDNLQRIPDPVNLREGKRRKRSKRQTALPLAA